MFLQQYATNNNYELVVVATYYDLELMTKKYNLKNPLFAIDVEKYKSDFTEKYLKRFLNELLNGQHLNSKDDAYLFFEEGIFSHSSKAILIE